MSAIAQLPNFPERRFQARYWNLPGGKQVWIYLSAEAQPHMLAVDLHDPDPHLAPVVSRMRAGQLPFRDAREVRAGVHGRFLVAEMGA